MKHLSTNLQRVWAWGALAPAIALVLSSCTTPSTLENSSGAAIAQPAPEVLAQTPTVDPVPSETATDEALTETVPVKIYAADANCEVLLSELVTVTAATPVEDAVAEVLQRWQSADFDLAGYRVEWLQEVGYATVELRVRPNSDRQFVSLSQCERFALFGSLRQTLLENSLWGIQTVRFLVNGEEFLY